MSHQNASGIGVGAHIKMLIGASTESNTRLQANSTCSSL